MDIVMLVKSGLIQLNKPKKFYINLNLINQCQSENCVIYQDLFNVIWTDQS